MEVVEHDDEKAHVVIRLEREKNREESLEIDSSVLTCEQQTDPLFRCSEALQFIGNDLESKLWMTDDLWHLGSSSRIICTFQILFNLMVAEAAPASPPVSLPQHHLCIIATNDLRNKLNLFKISLIYSHAAISKVHF